MYRLVLVSCTCVRIHFVVMSSNFIAMLSRLKPRVVFVPLVSMSTVAFLGCGGDFVGRVRAAFRTSKSSLMSAHRTRHAAMVRATDSLFCGPHCVRPPTVTHFEHIITPGRLPSFVLFRVLTAPFAPCDVMQTYVYVTVLRSLRPIRPRLSCAASSHRQVVPP